jgi:hypothetical protein
LPQNSFWGGAALLALRQSLFFSAEALAPELPKIWFFSKLLSRAKLTLD